MMCMMLVMCDVPRLLSRPQHAPAVLLLHVSPHSFYPLLQRLIAELMREVRKQV